MAVEVPQGGSVAGADVSRAAESIVAYAVAHSLIAPDDAIWAYNATLEAAGAEGPAAGLGTEGLLSLDEVSAAELCGGTGAEALEGPLAVLADAAVANGVEEDTPSGRDRVATAVMGRLTPRPSEVAARFWADHAESPVRATDRFYRLSCDVRYVREVAIARNLAWTSKTPWGQLQITINLSKPEKDPKAIAAAGAAKATDAVYPACQLCLENEGYRGRGGASPAGPHPARQNLRIVPIELGGERWGLQYSPYAYFNEHCIAMSSEHRPMHVDRENLSRLLDFVDLLPHYFVGSNADLPIVGGSILSHDHFQGGRHTFPMMRAEVAERRPMPGFDGVELELLRWPISTLRLVGRDRSSLLDAAQRVLDVWRGWTDEEVGVFAQTDGTPHNTVTPVVRAREDGSREVYLSLRCNVTTDEHPLGVFHPHAEWHHIKKENIGLIEVMGLAILPPRLVNELGRVEELLLGSTGAEGGAGAEALEAALRADALAAAHADWALGLAAGHPELCAENVRQIVRDGVGEVFQHVLEDAGVFKWDERGRAAQKRFLDAL